MEINGRLLERSDMVKAIRRGLVRRRTSLEKSLAHSRAQGWRPGERDLARWAKLRAEIAEFEAVLARIEAGGPVPVSPKTGQLTALLPDRIDGGDDAKR